MRPSKQSYETYENLNWTETKNLRNLVPNGERFFIDDALPELVEDDGDLLVVLEPEVQFIQYDF